MVGKFSVIYAGNRLSEWAQRGGTDIALNIDNLPKAFLFSDIEFFGESRRRFTRQYGLQRPFGSYRYSHLAIRKEWRKWGEEDFRPCLW